jgi:hypothetical protein
MIFMKDADNRSKFNLITRSSAPHTRSYTAISRRYSPAATPSRPSCRTTSKRFLLSAPRVRFTGSIRCERYLDRSDNENELKQVLGELISAHDIGDDDVLILGRDGASVFVMQVMSSYALAGMLLAGPNSKLFESQIMQYVSLLARELCIRNYFLRLFVLDDTLKKVRRQRQRRHGELFVLMRSGR